MKVREEISKKMNALGAEGEAFVFLIDFEGERAEIFSPDECNRILWKTREASNFKTEPVHPEIGQWEIEPVSFDTYKKGFDLVQQHIHNGDTYLLNYTQPTPVKTNLSLTNIFERSAAPYKILFRDEFVCFSPEAFVQINNGKIASFPMKGTMDAGIENAEELILKDSKELAEHNTIVDLIRNDLSLVAENVTVEKFRYLERIRTNRRDLFQVSSKITGDLPGDYTKKIGDIIFTMLPAGSISGAPKKKTVEIIKAAENYERGFYTGIFGYFDGQNLDSCVLIRYIENCGGQLVYKSGGGITFLSEAEKEYEELIKKVYVPIFA
ncbi:aminodeoxychorismate synthase component I [Maribellus sediminis]|uniref:aminodeoxychorismate synthase component I n=1 Tax=Maribellus sediminis TaxID=2696285 RepID=UPI00142F8C46|nr:aminodeoxychorismate synthase component I [Maribellus sediminis]